MSARPRIARRRVASPWSDAVALVRIGKTNVYEPEVVARGERMRFLSWLPADASPIAVDDIWAAAGTPRIPGYIVFLDRLPASADAPAFEAALRDVLPPLAPTSTGIAWARYSSEPTVRVTLLALLPAMLDDAGCACLSSDVQLPLPDGMLRLPLARLSRLLAADASPPVRGIVITYPPATEGAEFPRPVGITLPLSGESVGCLCFDALRNVAGAARGETSVSKMRVQVQIDPLRPFDPARTFQVLTGDWWVVSHDDTGYHLAHAAPLMRTT